MKTFGINYRKTYDPCDFAYFSSYSNEQLLSLLIGIIDGDGSISRLNNTNYIIITAHKNWETFYRFLISKINIDFHINNINGKDAIRIQTGKRENIEIFKKFIKNNNLQVLDRK